VAPKATHASATPTLAPRPRSTLFLPQAACSRVGARRLEGQTHTQGQRPPDVFSPLFAALPVLFAAKAASTGSGGGGQIARSTEQPLIAAEASLSPFRMPGPRVGGESRGRRRSLLGVRRQAAARSTAPACDCSRRRRSQAAAARAGVPVAAAYATANGLGGSTRSPLPSVREASKWVGWVDP